MLSLWPDAKGQTVVGFGFAVPLLRPYLAQARRVIGLMPGPQGVMPWPAGEQNVAVLCEDTLWPLQTGVVDKLVVMHGLETSDYPNALLEECWRVLGPGGRAVFIVPNRSGLWSRSDNTPFGYGRPYSLGQLEAQLRKAQFVTETTLSALYQPPSHRKIWRNVAGFLETVGHKMPLIRGGGVLMVEVSKQMAAPVGPGLREAVKRPLKAFEGMGKPVAEPVGSQGLPKE
jgi:SAM-dependent methyltransferase